VTSTGLPCQLMKTHTNRTEPELTSLQPKQKTPKAAPPTPNSTHPNTSSYSCPPKRATKRPNKTKTTKPEE